MYTSIHNNAKLQYQRASEITFLAASSKPSNACRGRPLSAIYQKPPVSTEERKTSGIRMLTYHLLSKFLVCSAEPHHHGYLHIEVSEGKDNAFSDHVTPRQSAKNIHEDCLDPLIGADCPEGRLDRFRGGFAAGIEEVSAVTTVNCKCIDCIHGETSSVD